MRIEPAKTEDVDALVEAWVELAETQRHHGSHLRAAANRSAMRPILAYHVAEGTVIVARADGSTGGESEHANPGRLLGFVNFGFEDAGLAGDARRGIVHNVYVEPDARGGGVGSELLDAAETTLADRGADVIAIEALAANEGARRLYRERGYRPHRVQYERTVGSDTNSKEGV